MSLECAKDDIDLEFRQDPSLREVSGMWSMMDSSRFLQVLLNLLTVRTGSYAQVTITDATNRTQPNLHAIDLSVKSLLAWALL